MTQVRDPDPLPGDCPLRSGGKDVARLAGVSTATVSRALNRPDRVDPQTRRRVLEAAAKLRYVPHGAARSLRSHRSKMIGAVVPSFDYALYARTTSALQQRLDARGYSLVLAEQHYDLAAELRVARQLVQHGVDAFVFVGLDHDPALFSLLEDYGRPYVLTWGIDPHYRHPSIGFDNQAATAEITRHLLQLGHTRFGLLSAPVAGNDRARARGAGVRQALSEAGLDLPAPYVAYEPISLQS
ncbi:MAG TPA: LacI family DNA-binding transcriptional regulator, partial [Lautropia sp.]|nr:LacI family DNA-binding transcriptional regulator [Lautropia sp.]